MAHLTASAANNNPTITNSPNTSLAKSLLSVWSLIVFFIRRTSFLSFISKPAKQQAQRERQNQRKGCHRQ